MGNIVKSEKITPDEVISYWINMGNIGSFWTLMRVGEIGENLKILICIPSLHPHQNDVMVIDRALCTPGG